MPAVLHSAEIYHYFIINVYNQGYNEYRAEVISPTTKECLYSTYSEVTVNEVTVEAKAWIDRRNLLHACKY